MEIVEMRQLSCDGHLPMKNAPESVGYEIWPSCDMVLKSQTVTSVRTSVRVDLPPGYAGVIYNKLGLAQEGIVVVPYVLDANFQGPLHLVVHNMGERDYRVLKENPLAQLVIHCVAALPMCHVVLPHTSPIGYSKVSSPVRASGEFPNIIPLMPRQMRTVVSPGPYRLHSLESPMRVPRVLFRDTDTFSSDSDGVLFPECSTPSSSGTCSHHNGGLPDSELGVPLTNNTATMHRVTRSLTRRGLGHHLEINRDL